ncbi:MAG: hypothetical protein A2W23_06425 [Planctomycetes bacterium RBG_16_43_13]|nr:MAG: hypothetical protein A2W23_06425 [Planctomycetes bacterium RBG_16_43_13]
MKTPIMTIRACFFCDRLMIPKGIGPAIGKKLYKQWQEEYGYICREDAKIGNKPICHNCLSELEILLISRNLEP